MNASKRYIESKRLMQLRTNRIFDLKEEIPNIYSIDGLEIVKEKSDYNTLPHFRLYFSNNKSDLDAQDYRYNTGREDLFYLDFDPQKDNTYKQSRKKVVKDYRYCYIATNLYADEVNEVYLSCTTRIMSLRYLQKNENN